MTSKELQAYATAGSVAEEVLSSIRTVAAFGGEKKEVERYNIIQLKPSDSANLKRTDYFYQICYRYNEKLAGAEKQGIKKGKVKGFFVGYMWMMIFLSYALGFWYGSSLVFDETNNFSPGNMMTVGSSIFQFKKVYQIL